MNENDSRRESAKWIAALEELIKAGYAVQDDGKGEVYRITDTGYKLTEE